MTKQVQRRRGTTTEHASFTGAVGEITVDTTARSLRVHDGVKVGGYEGGGFVPGTSLAARSMADRLRDWISVKDFGATGDGATDDSAALQAAFDYVAANGGTLYLPAGTYRLVAANINLTSAARPFRVVGAGMHTTKLLRGADTATSVLNIGGFNDWSLEDFGIDAGHDNYPNGNHGLAFFNCKNVTVLRLKVVNWKNSAILGYGAPPMLEDTFNVIQDCFVDGYDASNNGILFADMARVAIVNCQAVRIGKDAGLSPCYALQLKNGCTRSAILGGYAQGAKIGVAIGTNTSTEINENNLIEGVHIFDCNTGIAFGAGDAAGINRGHVVNGLIIDQNDTGQAAFDLQRRTYGVRASNINILNVANAKYGVRFRDGDHDNFVEIGSFNNLNNRSCKPVFFGAAVAPSPAAYNNSVVLRHYLNDTDPAVESSDMVDNDSGLPSNTFTYTALNLEQSSSIASGQLTLDHGGVTFVRPIPQGVVDPTPASDDLEYISPGRPNQVITLAVRLNTHTVTVKHNITGGNIRLAGASDMVLNNVNDTITLRYQFYSHSVSPFYYWVEVSRATYTTP